MAPVFALPASPADGDLYNELLNAEVNGAAEEHLLALRLQYHQVECARLERLWRESNTTPPSAWRGSDHVARASLARAGEGEKMPPLRGRPLVEFLVQNLNEKETAIYRKLKAGHIPGVQKNDPTKDKSHWFAPDPEDSVRRYFAGERGDRRAE